MPDPGVPEWAERAARGIFPHWQPESLEEAAGVILREFGSENLRKLEKWPEMVKALRKALGAARGEGDSDDYVIDILEAALAGEPEA